MEEKNKENNLLSLLENYEEQKPDPKESEVFEKKILEKHETGRKKISALFIIMFSALLGSGIAISFVSDKKEKNLSDIPEINNFDEFSKGRISGSLRSAMNVVENKELNDNAAPVEIKEKAPSRTLSKHSGNFKKDEEILQKYASAMDSASSENSFGTRSARRRFVPGGETKQGGVFMKGINKKDGTETKNLDLHDIKIKVRLEFSIRSTASSTIIAVVTEDHEKISKGSKFYGTASGYSNKRTQIRFNKLTLNGEGFSVQGFAISGRDPGIESEVTDISKDNIDSTVKQGITQTAANVVAKYAGIAGNVTGDAAANTVNPASSEIKKQQETNKMTSEYRVPAGTSFFIYLE